MKFRFTSNDLTLELLSSIDSVAMFPITHTSYSLLGEKPDWLHLLGNDSANQHFILNQPESFLENFLIDARKFWQNKQPGSLRSGKWVQVDHQGMDHPFEASATILNGRPVLLVQQISDRYLEIRRILQTARENAINQQKIEHLAYHDELTGLYNRRGFFMFAEKHLLLARREVKAVTIGCFDLDKLKHINDRYGHSTGDLAIANTAKILTQVCRHMDIVARIGGDEFVVLMLNMSSAHISSFNTRMVDAINDWNRRNPEHLHLSCSIGLASDDAEPIELQQLLHLADETMYKNKQCKYQRDIAAHLAPSQPSVLQ